MDRAISHSHDQEDDEQNPPQIEFDDVGQEPEVTASSPDNRRRFLYLASFTLVLLTVTGLASIGYYVFLTRVQSQDIGWVNPWRLLESTQIEAGIAVTALAEYAVELQYQAAMARDSVETATAATITAPDLNGDQRLGWLTVLARRQGINGYPEKSRRLYLLAADAAILEPDIGDLQRSETLLAIAQGWTALRREDMARDALSQVVLIVQHSLQLTPPVRSQLLERVAEIYEMMNDHNAASSVRALPVRSSPVITGQVIDPLEVLSTSTPYPRELINFQTRRIEAAQAYVDSWTGEESHVPRSIALALEAALIDEDLLRTALYERELRRDDLPAEDRARLLWDQVQWLLVKYRIAQGLYGEPLVPSWRDQASTITDLLHEQMQQFGETLTSVNQQRPVEEQGEALYQLRRQQVIWARLGFDPLADQSALATELNDALAAWSSANGLYPMAIIDPGGNIRYSLQVVTGPGG